MQQRYVVFDVETPNSANDRISAIGVSVVEHGRVEKTFYSLVNPETRFDWFNVQLTGITPEMTADQPAFPALWQALAPVFDGAVLVAHNAPFDLGVLSKCLRQYGILWRERVPYVCTCQLGRRLMPQLPDHRLNTLCGHLHIGLDHHHAGSDSRACAEILLHCLQRGPDMDRFLRTYDLTIGKTVPKRSIR